MARKKRLCVKRRKNRGGERLKEWKVLKEFGCAPPVRRLVSDELIDASVEMEMSNEGEDDITLRHVVDEELIVEKDLGSAADSFPYVLTGRRIVDFKYVFEELVALSEHAPHFGCSLSNIKLVSEVKRGLKSGFVFECNMCGIKKTVWSESQDNELLDLNTAAVAGSISNGGGFVALERLLGTMNVRCMSTKTYEKHEAIVSKGWEESALQEMEEAAMEEKRLAVERGDVDVHGTPQLTVVADGSWAKRSYRRNYNSLSGMAAIVGYHTRKVLYFGVKNKYCVTCARRSKANKAPKEHVCFRNWSGSASSMEAATIVEGFLASEDMYGVHYARMIADGDSSVYNSILEARPYAGHTVEKIECRNHLLRNYCNKLKDLSTTCVRSGRADFDRALHLRMRRVLGGRIMRLRAGVKKAIAQRKQEDGQLMDKAQKLRLDILNGPSHVFGEHLHCVARGGYFCTAPGPKEGETNHIPDMKKVGLYQAVMEAVNALADLSSHLIYDVDSNVVEHCNSAVARYTGGKRINFCQKGSYKTRCAAAVVSHNTGKAFYKLHKTLKLKSPGTYSKLYENRALMKCAKDAARKLLKPKARRSLKFTPQADDKHYGPNAQKPDMDPVLYDTKVAEHLQSLRKTEAERKTIELNTRGQNDSHQWFEERRVRLTASNFGLICNRKPHSSCASVVTSLLYSTITTPALMYGKANEENAIRDLEISRGIKVVRCGFFIDSDMPFLGASPDGLVDEDGIVEVKCPSSGEHLTPSEVVDQKLGLVGGFWKRAKDGQWVVKKTHKYYFQVQGQLHITKRNYCLFVLWTPKGIKVETIDRDDDFWESNMKEKLEKFYLYCLLPEIIDPRKRRSLPIRDPEYILEAQLKRTSNDCKV